MGFLVSIVGYPRTPDSTNKVRGLLQNIPEVITADISGLDIDNTLKVNELHIDNVEFVENPNSVIVAVLSTRNVEAAPTEA